ncbi:MAG: hypothetical protein II110_00260, partial [Treponema sp.]|nr:hypothetical protein [Treponema sp.]
SHMGLLEPITHKEEIQQLLSEAKDRYDSATARMEHQPSPDWKGAERVAVRQWSDSGTLESGKKMPSLAFFPASFLAKTCRLLPQTIDAPSVALHFCK